MCGIFGIIDQNKREIEPEELRSGLKILAHRGPDGEGTYFEKNIALGHRRLAIFDLSEKGHQPMTFCGKVIVFNGAIYNFPELRRELEKDNYTFHTGTDTEVILAAYDRWGTECVDRFNGQWAFAIYDPEKKIIFCSRDRFGIKPFYYTVFDNRFYFASEIKAFTRQRGWHKKLNITRAYEFLAYGLHEHTAETMYEGVFQLPQGNHLIYDLQRHDWELKPYYSLKDQIVESRMPFAEACEKFRFLLQDAVRLRLRADVPFCSALSGGLDSSALVRIMQGLLGQRSISAVSVCFPENPEIDESSFIDVLQEEKSFHSIRIIPDHKEMESLVEKVSWHQEEPISSYSVIAQYLVFRKAHSAGLKVMLDGQGADEILGGYPKFYAPYFKKLIRRNPAQLIPAIWNLVQLHHWPLEKIWNKMSALSAKSKGLIPAWIHPDFQPDPKNLYRPASVSGMSQLSVQLITEMGLPALLHYEDRNAMANGVESRLPFLDHRLVAFCLSLKDDYRIHDARRKYILREAMKTQLPKAIYQRYDKLGFAVPDWAPSAEQLHQSIDVLKQSDRPILNVKADLKELPHPVKERIFFFSKFMEQNLGN